MATFKGISFPFKADSKSFPKVAEDAELIRQSIIRIIMTRRTERLMRPGFGSSVIDRVFDNNDKILESVLRSDVCSSVGQNESRAAIRSVSVEQEDNNTLVTVDYVILATKKADQVQVSFPNNR